MTVWRSRLDDTDRQQLTFPPMEVRWPSWSPDGVKLVINARFPGKPWKLYVIRAEGGSPEQLIPGPESESFPDWSPDGRQIVFSGSPFLEPESAGPDALYLLDLTTKRVTRIPGSPRGEDWIIEGVPAHGWTGAMLERLDARQRAFGSARYRLPGNLRPRLGRGVSCSAMELFVRWSVGKAHPLR
jgi:hypothetical protein